VRSKRSRCAWEKRPTSSRSRAAAVCILSATVYTILGIWVSHRPPSAFDQTSTAFVAHGAVIDVAWIFTASCLWYVLLPYGIAGVVVAIRSPGWRPRIAIAIILTLAAWQTSNVLKDVFGRPRPEHWVRVHESSLSYSSGHAMFAVMVYGLWAWFVWRSSLPDGVRRTVAPLLALWGLGVLWSRLALGAHYPTDLIGGILLATAFIALGYAIVPDSFAAPRALARLLRPVSSYRNR